MAEPILTCSGFACFIALNSSRWCFLLPVERLKKTQLTQLERLCQGATRFAVLYRLTQAFVHLLHEQSDRGLTPWFKEVQNSGIEELISFAKGLQRDEAAVRAGLSLKWSQGPVEGNVNRLKFIKRSMYDIVGECLASGQ